MEKPKDFYRILGVARDATRTAIKQAYRRLARKLHPDTARSDRSAEFHAVQAAYDTLVDAARRRRYDQDLAASERFDTLDFSFVSLPSPLRRPVSPGTVSGEIVLTPEEAEAGGVLNLDVPLTATCPACEGTGGSLFGCMTCGGDGHIERRLPLPLRIPPRVPEGTVFQVTVDDPTVVSVLLTVHIRPF